MISKFDKETFDMKNLRQVLFVALILMLVGSGYSQSTMSGKVVEVIDGKTVVIEISSGKLTAELRYIEIPEREQPLYWTVRDHLEKLVLGKRVEFHPKGLMSAKTVGQLYVDGLDIAQQMLRDGAAWHITADKSGQKTEESSAYQYNQEQAKGEKRGVWGVENLKPAWEFRAEKIENARRQENALTVSANVSDVGVKAVSTKPVATRRPGMWPDINPNLKNVGALLNGYNAKTKMGYIGTSFLGVAEIDKEKENSGQRTEVNITYYYKEDDQKGRKGIFLVTVMSLANEWRFLQKNDLVVVADEKSTLIGKAKRTTFKSTNSERVGETMTYEVSRSAIEKIVNGGDVIVKVGEYMIRPNHGLQLLLYNMLQVSE
jgi:endonuclease YncB( thermonuclease family)